MHAQIDRMPRCFWLCYIQRLKHGIGRANPYNAYVQGGCNKISSARRVYKTPGAVLKVVPVTLVNFFTCLDWAVFYSHQQMDAPRAQEK
jgi:hypothetical protein